MPGSASGRQCSGHAGLGQTRLGRAFHEGGCQLDGLIWKLAPYETCPDLQGFFLGTILSNYSYSVRAGKITGGGSAIYTCAELGHGLLRRPHTECVGSGASFCPGGRNPTIRIILTHWETGRGETPRTSSFYTGLVVRDTHIFRTVLPGGCDVRRYCADGSVGIRQSTR